MNIPYLTSLGAASVNMDQLISKNWKVIFFLVWCYTWVVQSEYTNSILEVLAPSSVNMDGILIANKFGEICLG